MAQPSSMSLVFAVFAIFMIHESLTEEGCPVDLPDTTHMASFRGKCYQYVSAQKKWTDARDYCWEHGGSLVSLNDEETNKFVTETLSAITAWSSNGVWIGLNDRENSHYWQWVTADASVSADMIWSNWGVGHPRTGVMGWGEGDCIRMKRKDDWKWHEASCDAFFRQYRFICQYEQEIVTTQTPEYIRIKVAFHTSNDDILTESLDGLDPALYAGAKNTSEARSLFNYTLIAGLCLIILVLCVLFGIHIIRKRNRNSKPPSYEETLYEDISVPNAAMPLTVSNYKPNEPDVLDNSDVREHKHSNMYVEPDFQVLCEDGAPQKSSMEVSQTSTGGYVEPSKVMALSQLSDTYLSPLTSPTKTKTATVTGKTTTQESHEYENTQLLQPRKLPDLPDDYLPMGGSKRNISAISDTNVPSAKIEEQESELNEQIYSEI